MAAEKAYSSSFWPRLARTGGLRVEQREYPVYHSYFGGAVGQLLSGQAGVQADQVDGKSMALWFALDRWEDLQTYRDGQADVLLINRYVLSNGVYQSIREIDLGKPDLVDWVFDLEYNHFGLPRADVFVFYDVEPAQAGENVLKKGHRDYLGNRVPGRIRGVRRHPAPGQGKISGSRRPAVGYPGDPVYARGLLPHPGGHFPGNPGSLAQPGDLVEIPMGLCPCFGTN